MLGWSAAIFGALACALLALAADFHWWALEGAALVSLGGAFVGLEETLRSRQRLATVEDRLVHIDHGLPDILFEATPDGAIRSITHASIRLLGYTPEEMRGRHVSEFTADPLPSFRADGPASRTWTTEWKRADGSTRTFTSIVEPIWREGRLRAIRGVVRDQAERVAAESALRESEARFRRVLDAAQNGIMLVGHEGKILLTNDALRNLLGEGAPDASGNDLAGRDLASIVHPAYIDQLMALMASRAWSDAAPSHYEVQLLGRGGALIEVEVSLATFKERERNTGVLIEVRDLTEARRASEAIRRMSDYDRLTGLPNRDLFDRHLQRALIDAKAAQRHVAVVLIDLDRFKLINDTLGHPSGDRLLFAVAQRLQSKLPPQHLLARFSGDEYLVLCPDLSGIAAAEGAARRVIASFDEPFELDGHQLQVSATGGVAVFPTHAEDPATLVRIADAALHEAKAGGGNTYRMGSNDANDPARRRLELESDLRRAVDQRELRVHYQPQVDPTSGEVRGFEALLRWDHCVRGNVGPDEFVPLLEDTGLIVEVGDFVLREACIEAKRWHDAGHDRLRVAVNLAPRQFLVSDLDERIRAALADSGLPPWALEVELTESAGLLDFDAVAGVLDSLAEIGVTTAIDDFGIGQSWLSRLQQFHIGTLKVDRTFIQRIMASGNDFAIVEAVVALGHALGMDVVAEGVETREQLDVVRAIGCDLVQGFYYSPAVAPDAIEALLRDGFTRPIAVAV
ncbi:MAG: EAL domain-containing protein [Dehalococcoidia bacterium]